MGMARNLRRKGVDAKVLAPCDGRPAESWVFPLGKSVPYAQNGSLAPVAPDPAAQLRILAAIRDERFDVLHIHEPLVPGPSLTALVMQSVPMVGTFHVSGEVKAYRWLKPAAKRLARRLALSVAVSNEAAAMAKRSLDIECEILFNAVELQDLPLKTHVGKPHRVFFVGRHEPRKGLSVLLEAFSALPKEFELRIAGQGPETEKLKNEYRDLRNIVWLGAIEEAEKAQELADAEIFVAPSLGGESFGIVLLEAMAAGVKLVVSDLEAYASVTNGQECAALFSTGDSVSLQNALLAAVENPDKAQQRVDNGRARVSEFSMDRLTEAYIDCYQRAISLANN